VTLWFGLCISCYKLFLTVYESLFIVTTLISISYYSLLMQFTSHLFPFIEWHTFSSFNTLGFLCSKYTLCARLGSRYWYPAKTIGYSQLIYIRIFFYHINYTIKWFTADFGERFQRYPLKEIRVLERWIWMNAIA